MIFIGHFKELLCFIKFLAILVFFCWKGWWTNVITLKENEKNQEIHLILGSSVDLFIWSVIEFVSESFDNIVQMNYTHQHVCDVINVCYYVMDGMRWNEIERKEWDEWDEWDYRLWLANHWFRVWHKLIQLESTNNKSSHHHHNSQYHHHHYHGKRFITLHIHVFIITTLYI